MYTILIDFIVNTIRKNVADNLAESMLKEAIIEKIGSFKGPFMSSEMHNVNIEHNKIGIIIIIECFRSRVNFI